MEKNGKHPRVWVVGFHTQNNALPQRILASLVQSGLDARPAGPSGDPDGPTITLVDRVTSEVCAFVQSASRNGTERVLVLMTDGAALADGCAWQLLQDGASDVLVWSDLPNPADVLAARLHRWKEVDDLLASPFVQGQLVGQSRSWITVLRQIVEVARFTDAPVLLTGETGTGKELVARLIHSLDQQRCQHDLVIQDCTTIVPELSGSELFGHERGAFTGAVAARDGAFTLADQGTLFLDEVGELSLELQVKLLRVLQEHTYKRVGSNVWRNTDFRLICATNRDLLFEVAQGQFRRDLYYRIAAWTFKLPPLRERVDDILPLVCYFMQQARSGEQPPALDEQVRVYFLKRDYPGNVRDLRNLVFRVMSRHVGPGPITIGDIPDDERPTVRMDETDWRNGAFDQAIHGALTLGIGLKELTQGVKETAIRIAVDQADGNLQRAADRLGVTDRSLQLWRAERQMRVPNVSVIQ